MVVPAGTETATPSIVNSTWGEAATDGSAGGRDARAGGVSRIAETISGTSAGRGAA